MDPAVLRHSDLWKEGEVMTTDKPATSMSRVHKPPVFMRSCHGTCELTNKKVAEMCSKSGYVGQGKLLLDQTHEECRSDLNQATVHHRHLLLTCYSHLNSDKF